MRALRWMGLTLALAAAVSIGGSLGPGCARDQLERPFRRTYDHRPEAAFQEIFGRPPPPEVFDLRAAGEAWIGGANLWLRFRTTKPIVRDLFSTFSGEPDREEDLEDHHALWGAALAGYDPNDRLCWDDLYLGRSLEVYALPVDGGGRITAWVDRPANTVWVFRLGM